MATHLVLPQVARRRSVLGNPLVGIDGRHLHRGVCDPIIDELADPRSLYLEFSSGLGFCGADRSDSLGTRLWGSRSSGYRLTARGCTTKRRNAPRTCSR